MPPPATAVVKTGDEALPRTASVFTLAASFVIIIGGYIWPKARADQRRV
ncbi:MAG: hypothetical protein HY684_05315 [Chloroflexi bacterium]|nr:hypothetical protein [Chloroflexota bacterium]